MNNEESKRLVDEANARDAMSPDELRKDNFTRMFATNDVAYKEYMAERFSPIQILSRALDGFYKAYLQLNLPSCLDTTLRDETKKMVQELWVTDPKECRLRIIYIIGSHGRGKGDGYIQKKIKQADEWIEEAMEAKFKVLAAQLTEQYNGDNQEPDNQV